ncbi:ABC transporter permease [Candidatus Peregrinibacteria bacterium]|nr:ABC transporter permease [Candidatus Peregrinibacteria bacterium]
MRIDDLFDTAIRGVTTNLTRSFLTMLGIIIGVGSVILMSAVGASMKGVILGQVSSLGAKSMVIFPGQEEGGAQAVMTGFDSLTFDDLEALEKLPSISNLAPAIFMSGKASYNREEATPQVIGVTEEFFRNQNVEAQIGRLIDSADDEGGRSVALLGSETAEELFGEINPLGKRVQVGDHTFTVIGVAKPLGAQFFQSADNRIYVPFKTSQDITGQKYINQITMLATDSFDLAFADVRYLLRQRHGISVPSDHPVQDQHEKDDFIVHSSEEATTILGSVSLGLTLFITTIAAISLIVGGIGIMNIMLVSVKERTREIGLRKAVGARGRDILFQFLTEAVLLTTIGGIIGLLIGLFLAWIIASFVTNILSTYVFAISLPSILAALAMAGGTGLIFGISPARRAAKLPPMEALRYE